jgi:chromatin segregation and condensation protein Rec8/ScpA/Scc1 (kleisin family)
MNIGSANYTGGIVEKLTDIQVTVLSILEQHVGAENRIPRADLRAQLCARADRYITDREMRRAIESLRQLPGRGSRICSTCGGVEQGQKKKAKRGQAGGYFIATSVRELEQFLREDEDRAVHTLRRTGQQRKAAGMDIAGVRMLRLMEAIGQ